MDKIKMIEALETSGAYLQQHANGVCSSEPKLKKLNSKFFAAFEETIKVEHTYNAWFTESNIRQAIRAIASMLEKDNLTKWLEKYPSLPVEKEKQKTVGVVMAGNIPLVGFHDFLSVLSSGHRFLGKPSSKDDRLIRKIAEILCAIEPSFSDQIEFTDNYLKEAEAMIATGSNNSSRYFEYYFKDIPHIIRKNRNGVAVLSGMESNETLHLIGEDIFSYFGLGCRNVTKIYIPEDFKIECLLRELEKFEELDEHHKYMNNISYYRSIYLLNNTPFLDNGLILVKETDLLSGPVGVVYYEKYSELNDVITKLDTISDQVQCIVSELKQIENRIAPGNTQSPSLFDYADGIDTMQFLTDLRA